ncbi:methyltransferase [Micromonospora sp. NPDC000663]|uniref:methyltransferase n=1 Tax=Micromonospora sp. NPDC000663 TaxID=3364218 RepID=UPI0036AE00FA
MPTGLGPDQTPEELATNAAAVMNLIAGGMTTQVLHALVALRIPDHVAEGAQTAAEVSRLEGSHQRATFRLMRAAASIGILTFLGEQRFGLSPRAHLLRSGVPGSLRSLLLVQAGPAHWKSLGAFPEAVRQGASQAEQVLGMSIFDYYSQPANAAEATAFSKAMSDVSGLVTAGVVAQLKTEGVTTIVDVGGADGHLVLGLIEDRPELTGVVLDLPHAADIAGRNASARGLADRFTAVAGDFFTAVPAGNLHLLKTVLHDWDDDRCLAILRNCRAATTAGGRAVVIEMLLGELGEPDFTAISDLAMLALTSGMERNLDEFDALFAATGWRRGVTYPVGAGYHAIEMEAV